MAPPNSKGKQAETAPPVNKGKRRREEDAALRTYDAASGAVAVFLRPPSTLPPPSNRRRLNEPSESDNAQAASSSSSDGDIQVIPAPSGSSSVTGPEISNLSPSSHPNVNNDGPASNAPTAVSSGAPFNADPFGYLDNRHQTGFSGGRTNFHSTSRTLYGSWGPEPSSAGSSVAITTAPAVLHNIPSQTRPIHTHAFVTFGAGMRQKEIDIYTASNPLKARTISGGENTVPYHIPLYVHYYSLLVYIIVTPFCLIPVQLTLPGLLLCSWEGLVF